jgi:methionyl-tRNA synthetase
MSEQKNIPDPFYITTAIAYANGAPHIGHAFEFVLTDAISRYRRVLGEDVHFVTGMDEHGQKIEGKAKSLGADVQELVDGYARMFQDLDDKLGVSYDFFVRTSDKEKHYPGAQALWKKLAEKGDLEKRTYTALYCIGCEEFKQEKDLDSEGNCPVHLVKPEVVEEENWFFRLSGYTDAIRGKISSGELTIYPETRKNEILALLDRGLEDVSFSRPKSKVSWGIPVPGDDEQVMYVWCDALANYLTAIGYGTDAFREDLWHNVTHVIGKDILRFHAAIWPGMLLSAGLPLPKNIIVHGHITSGGQKMSKTLGNVINPQELIDMFTPVAGELAGEVVRFILLHEVPSFNDGDITLMSIKGAYTGHLVNGIGNLTSRIMKLCEVHKEKLASLPFDFDATYPNEGEIWDHFYEFDPNNALHVVMDYVKLLDERIQRDEAFKIIKEDEATGLMLINGHKKELMNIATMLYPFIPKTSEIILSCIREDKMPEKPLFARLP